MSELGLATLSSDVAVILSIILKIICTSLSKSVSDRNPWKGAALEL